MLFLQTFMNNLVLTKFSCLKRDAIECTLAIFLFSCVCATQKAPPHPYLPTPTTATVSWLLIGWVLALN
jgi:hypothetical protein